MHYVYRLIDPRNGVPFYIGKGQKGRMYEHEHRVLLGRPDDNYFKCHLIREIHRSGCRVRHDVESQHETAGAAFAREMALIAEIGLHNLTNILPGGGGEMPPWEIARRAAALDERVAQRKTEERRAWLRRWLVMVERWPNGGTFPTSKDGDRLAAEFLATVKLLVAA